MSTLSHTHRAMVLRKLRENLAQVEQNAVSSDVWRKRRYIVFARAASRFFGEHPEELQVIAADLYEAARKHGFDDTIQRFDTMGLAPKAA